MSLIALLCFKRQPSRKAFLFVFGLTSATETLQMWSLSRHCRLTDAIPNFMGLFLAIATLWLIAYARSRFKPKKWPERFFSEVAGRWDGEFPDIERPKAQKRDEL